MSLPQSHATPSDGATEALSETEAEAEGDRLLENYYPAPISSATATLRSTASGRSNLTSSTIVCESPEAVGEADDGYFDVSEDGNECGLRSANDLDDTKLRYSLKGQAPELYSPKKEFISKGPLVDRQVGVSVSRLGHLGTAVRLEFRGVMSRSRIREHTFVVQYIVYSIYFVFFCRSFSFPFSFLFFFLLLFIYLFLCFIEIGWRSENQIQVNLLHWFHIDVSSSFLSFIISLDLSIFWCACLVFVCHIVSVYFTLFYFYLFYFLPPFSILIKCRGPRSSGRQRKRRRFWTSHLNSHASLYTRQPKKSIQAQFCRIILRQFPPRQLNRKLLIINCNWNWYADGIITICSLLISYLWSPRRESHHFIALFSCTSGCRFLARRLLTFPLSLSSSENSFCIRYVFNMWEITLLITSKVLVYSNFRVLPSLLEIMDKKRKISK